MNTDTTQIIDPKTLAWWTRILREACQWSQEALAEACGLNVRSIQRIEAGEPTSISTRRSLARGLGYENVDTFIDARFALDLHRMLEEIDRIKKDSIDKQFADFVRLSACRLKTGEQLGRAAETTNSYVFHYDDDISDNTKDIAAAIFDYVRDYADVDDLYSEGEKLSTYRSFAHLLRELESNGSVAHYAIRTMKITGKDLVEKTPMRLDILYLVIGRLDKEIKDIMSPKKPNLGL